MTKPIVSFTKKERDVAYQYHGGMGSMLYAGASSNGLRRGTIRPYGIRTNAEWDVHLAEKLETEATAMAVFAQDEARHATTAEERKEFLRDADTLLLIAGKARQARFKARPTRSKLEARKRGRLGSARIQEYLEEQIGNYFITVRSKNGSCAFTITDDRTGWSMEGGEPGPCSNARAAARRIVMRRRSRR